MIKKLKNVINKKCIILTEFSLTLDFDILC